MIETLSQTTRTALADRLRALSDEVAETTVDALYTAQPELLERFGAAGRRHAVQDTAYHVAFLAGALDLGAARAFGDYVRWTARVLESRGMRRELLLDALLTLWATLEPLLLPDDRASVAAVLEAGKRACAPESAVGDGVGEGAASADEAAGGDGPLVVTREAFLQAILQGQRQAALTMATEAHRAGHSVPEIYRHVLQAALYRVGELWERNVVTVAQEHMATAICQFVVAQLYPLVERPDHTRGRAVVTGVQGELHQVGANMVADVLESDGWDVRFLGTDMPHDGIVDAVLSHNAALVGISSTMTFNVGQVARLAHAVTDRRPGAALILGGGAFRSAPDTLAAQLGARGVGLDLDQAIDLARRAHA